MSAADDLQKLSELLQKGLLTQAEFDKQKKAILEGESNTPKKKKSWPWWQWALAIFLGLVLFGNQISKIEGGVPSCDSSTAQDTLKEAFDQSQFARSLNLSVVEIANSKETSFDKDAKMRVCTAKITMNNTTDVNVEYKIEGRENGQFMLTFETQD